MTKAAQQAVSAIMGVIRQQTSGLDVQDTYDALDEIVDQSSDLFSFAKGDLSDHPHPTSVKPSPADNQGIAPLRVVDSVVNEVEVGVEPEPESKEITE